MANSKQAPASVMGAGSVLSTVSGPSSASTPDSLGGASPHEEPRLVPYSEWIVQPGMVFMLEPGIYLPGETSVRLEDAVLVTSDGGEVLTRHDKSLPHD